MYRVIHLTVPKFSNKIKSCKDSTKLLDGKQAEFYGNFSDINFNQQSLHSTLISKSGQNADKSGIWLFSNFFWDLLSENVHIVTK